STLPGLQWHVYDPVGRDNALAGAKLAFGRELAPVYRFDRAKVILSIDGNFLMDDPGSVRYARDFARSRGIDGIRRPIDSSEMARLYAVESTSTITGTKADHRLRLPPDEVQSVAREIARALGTGGETGAAAESPSTGPSTRPAESSHASAEERKHRFVQTVVADLRRAGAAAVVVAGECQPPEIHALAYAMNQTLGSVGNGDDKPVSFIKPPEANVANGVESLRDLLSAMDAGQVDLLLILGGNPAYTAPADLRFGERLKAFTDQLRPDGYPGWSVHLGEYFDETSLRCQWHLPEAHFLESWGDVRAYDGTACIVQPLISPLYQGRTASEVLASVLDRLTTTAGRTTGAAATQPGSAGDQPTGTTGPTTRGGEAVVANTGYEVLRAFWRKQVGEKNFEQWWQKTLARGVIEGTAYKSEQPSAQADLAALLNAPVTRPAAATTNPSATQPGGSIRVVFRPDPSVWDGRFSNNAWLQELPKPLTKLVWDNAVILSPNTARALGFAEELPANLTKTGDSDELHKVNGRLVSLTVGDRHLNGAPVWILPGHPDNVATLYFGYGRERLGRVANGMGFNAYALRTSANLWTAPNAEIKVQPGRYALATTQSSQVIDTGTNENRELVRHGTSADEIFEHVVRRLPIAEQPAARKAFQEQKNPGSRVSLPVIPDLDTRTERGTATDPGLPRSLYPGAPDQGTPDGSHNPNYPAWAMVIDLTACIGCNACVVACQSENNIP
ncbi:MAG TPA: hypothetical protein VL371_11950, partial [Gemmataceae bacterium]|nr:hypothetical protein [Gemmataceae bacterium]